MKSLFFYLTSLKLGFSLTHSFLVLFLSFSLFACEKVVDELGIPPVDEPTGSIPDDLADESEIYPNAGELKRISLDNSPFSFDFYVVDCTVTGKSIYTILENKVKYTFSWLVDGNYAGNKDRVECVVGSAITLTVTRISDGKSISKTLFYKPRQPSSSEE